MLPEIEFPRIFLVTNFPGMAPREVEQMLTMPLEKAIAGTEAINEIESRTERGLSVLRVSLDWGTERDHAMVALRQQLDRIYTTLPQNASRTEILPFNPARKPIALLHARDRGPGKRLRFFIDTVLRPELQRIPGVASLEIDGGFEREIQVSLDRPRLYGYGLDIRSVIQSLRSQNITKPVGFVRSGDYEKTVRVDGKARSLESLSKIPVGRNGESIIQLSDFANIQDGYADRQGQLLLNGKPAVLIGLRKEPSANTLATAERIRKAVQRLNRQYRKSLELKMIEDKSRKVSESIRSIRNAATLGSILAFALLLFFLNNLRTSLFVALTIPLSVLISCGALYLLDVSLNMMSLGGLTLGVGMLIDGSIMVTESIARSSDHDLDSGSITREKVYRGTSNVIGSLFASCSTTIVVFFPVIFLSGIAAALFRDLAIAVIVSTIAGLYCSTVFIPVLTIQFNKSKDPPIKDESIGKTQMPQTGEKQYAAQSKAAALNTMLEFRYRKLIGQALRRPGPVLVSAFTISILAIFLLALLPRSVMPEPEPSALEANMTLPAGTNFQATSDVARSIYQGISKHPGLKSSVIRVGQEGDDHSKLALGPRPGNEADFVFFVKSGFPGNSLLATLRNLIPEDQSLSLQIRRRPGPIHSILGEGSNQYQIYLSKVSDDLAHQVLEEASNRLKGLPGVIFVDGDSLQTSPVLDIRVDRKQAAHSGLNTLQIGRQLRSSVHGNVASLFREGDRSIDIRVRLAERFRNRKEHLSQIRMSGRKHQIALKGLINTRQNSEKPALKRLNQKRIHSLRFRIAPERKEETLEAVSNLLEQIIESSTALNDRAIYSVTPANTKAKESLRSLIFAFLFSGILIFQLMAAQFESLSQALALILTIPSILPGVAFALLITDQGLNISSAIGIILLAGIVINASIALHEAIQLRIWQRTPRNAAELKEILGAAGAVRIRPILLTALTTMGGILPLALGLGSGAQNQQPMAVAMLGGLASGTFASLIVYPTLYYILERRRFKA